MVAVEQAAFKEVLRNSRIASKLIEAATLLAARKADAFKIAAYTKAADSLMRLDQDVAEIEAKGGPAALDDIPNVGA